MGLTVIKTAFNGFGVRILSDGIYFCAEIPCANTAGIKIVSLDSGKEKYSIEIPKECAIGDVYSCLVKDLDISGCGYAFFSDNNVFPDKYATGFAPEKTFRDCALALFIKPVFPKDFETDHPLLTPYSDSVLYLLHVKGFTAMDNSAEEPRGTFEALSKKTGYLKELGVTGIILMPVFENVGRENYWGFVPSYHYAIKRSLSGNFDTGYSFACMVKEMHSEGIEVIMTMFFDYNTETSYINEVCTYYRTVYHVDGFRFVGGGINSSAIIANPFLKDSKLLFENIETGDVTVSPSKYKNVGIISHRFLSNARRFLKGDDDLVSYMSFAVRENSRLCAPVRNITDFAGFTLWDMVSYNRKHNESNGEDNTDGTNYNYSWNCGEEGPSKKIKVGKLRAKQIRNAAVITFLSQGTPMLVSGDECLNSNGGNNNPYNQDNPTGWVNWRKTKASADFFLFVKNLIAFRKRHSVLHQPKELMLFDYMSCKNPDVSFHGEEAWKLDQTPASREFAVLYSGDYARQYTGKTEDSVYIAYNMHWEEREFALPDMKGSSEWYLLYSSDGSTSEDFDESNMTLVNSKVYKASGRSVSILIQKKK